MTPAEIDAAVAALRSAATIRERCRQVWQAGLEGRLAHFRLHPERLEAAADYVTATIRAEYPSLAIPYHSRWRHFEAGGVDRWAALARGIGDPAERARSAADLAVVSVLLDAGAGPAWRYVEPASGATFARSEGLAVASLDTFRAGLFGAAPLRADATALARLDAGRLGRAFQATADNPLVGLAARADLLRRLGAALAARPDLFGAEGRIGRLLDHLGSGIAAADLLRLLLEAFAPIWPAGFDFHGRNLGDVGRHPAVRADGPTDGLVPFHKLTQWLAYSLLEPLEWAGCTVTGLDALTGLPEYRNGGLFIDLGVLEPRPGLATGPALEPRAEPVVEWRALTVVALDETAGAIRRRLGLSAEQLPLARVLQGGTWTAGRRIAAERRPGGPPPLAVATDGTTF